MAIRSGVTIFGGTLFFGKRLLGIRAAIAVGAIALVGASCTSPPAGPGGLQAPPTVDVWMVGDSLSYGTGFQMSTTPWLGSAGASGFTSSGQTVILDDVLAAISAYGAPDHVLVMAGVMDVAGGQTTLDITTAMQAFEDSMTGQGVGVVWVAEPGYQYSGGLDLLADWINTKPLSVDCRSLAGPHKGDFVHPNSYVAMAGCVADAVTTLGITW